MSSVQPVSFAARKRVVTVAAAALILVRRRRMQEQLQERKRRKNTRVWVRPWLQRRHQLGAYDTLLVELANEDLPGYVAFQRVAPDVFGELLQRVGPIIEKKWTPMREPISAGARLAITLRYLATGNSFMSLQFCFRVANNTICGIVEETCKALHTVLKDDYFKFPTCESDWLEIAQDFWDRWQFPNCIGAIDGKHVLIRPPAKSGSFFYNYKHTFSIVLMAVVDSHYKFLYVDVGCNGRVSDGGVWRHTDLAEALEADTADIPDDQPYPGDDINMPFAMVADEAFPLRRFIMKPFPMRNLDKQTRVYNYRLSRARRVVENAFGILANRWRALLTPLLVTPQKAELVVLSACALHNMLRVRLPAYTNACSTRKML